MKKNFLIVSKSRKNLAKKELIAKNVNWTSSKAPKLPLKVMARIRYNSTLKTAVIKKEISQNRYQIVFSKAQLSVTPGQSVVFYKGRELLGGGVIC